MDYASVLIYLDGLKASVAILFGFAAVAIYWKVRNRGKAAMTSFQLKEDEVRKDYSIILFANVFMVLAMVIQVMAGLDMVPVLLANLLRTVYIAVIVFVLVRWVNMFR